MERADSRDRIEWMGKALTALSERPDVIPRLEETLTKGDVEGFSKTLLGHWQDIEIVPPGDKCDPYVTAYVEVIRPPKYVRRCTWVGPARIESTGGETYTVSGNSERVLEMLIALGLVKCEWVSCSRAQPSRRSA